MRNRLNGARRNVATARCVRARADLPPGLESGQAWETGDKKGARRIRRAPRSQYLATDSPVRRQLCIAPGELEHTVRERCRGRILDGRDQPESETLHRLRQRAL